MDGLEIKKVLQNNGISVVLQHLFYSESFHYARSTAPERKHLVQTYIFFVPPFTFTLTDFTLDFHILLDLLWEWLTLIPK